MPTYSSIASGDWSDDIWGSLIDDGDAEVSYVGSWGTFSDFHFIAAGSGSNSATYLFSGLSSGSYNVYFTWTAGGDRPTDTPWAVLDSDGTTVLSSGTINQQNSPAADLVAGGKNYQLLYAATITGSSVSLRFTDGASSGFIVLDIALVKSATGGGPSNSDPVRIRGGTSVALDGNITREAATTINGTLTGSGVTFTVKEDVNGSGTASFGAGFTLAFDSGTSNDISWLVNSLGSLSIVGTSGSRSAITHTGGGTACIDAEVGTSSLTLQFCDVSGLVDPTGVFGVKTSQNFSAAVLIEDSTFDGCAASPYQAVDSVANYAVRRVRWTNVSGSNACNVNIDNNPADGSCEFVECSTIYNKPLRFGKLRGVTFDGCAEGIAATGTGAAAVRNCFFRADDANAIVMFDGCPGYDNLFILHDHSGGGNPHFMGVTGDQYANGCIFDFPWPVGTIDFGDCILGTEAGGLNDVEVRNCLAVPSESDGLAPGYLCTIGSTTSKHFRAYHNTVAGLTARLLFIKDPGYSSSDQTWSQVKSNLCYSPSNSSPSYAVYDLDVDTLPYDVVRGDGCSHNGFYNPGQYTDPSNGDAEYDGYNQRFATSGTPGSNDIIADPQFVDFGRNFCKWAVHKGAALSGDTVRDKIDAGVALILDDPSLIETDLIPWVKAGYAPTNPVYQDAGHDSVTIGAVEYQAAGSSSSQSRLLLLGVG